MQELEDRIDELEERIKNLEDWHGGVIAFFVGGFIVFVLWIIF